MHFGVEKSPKICTVPKFDHRNFSASVTDMDIHC